MRIVFTFIMALIGVALFSQNVGISNTAITPDASAGLEVQFTDKGILIPRVALTSVSDGVTITNPATSLLVYNDASGGLNPAGFYYNSGTPAAPNWKRMATGTGDLDDAWQLLGNSGTNPATNFLGTTDAQDLVFRTNNTEWMRLQTDGTLCLGTATDNNSKLRIQIDPTNTTDAYSAYFYNDGTNTAETYGIFNVNNSFTATNKYGLYNYVNADGNGGRYGIRNEVYQSSAGTNPAYGTYNSLRSYYNSSNFGMYSYHEANGTGAQYGTQNILNLVNSTGSGAIGYASANDMRIGNSNSTSTVYGEYTQLDFSLGTKYGEYKRLNTTASYSATKYADYNYFTGSGTGSNYGYYNNFSISGSGLQSGLRNQFFNVSATKYGMYNSVPNGTATGSFYGVYNDNNNDGTGEKTGIYNYFASDYGPIYGVRNNMQQNTTHNTVIYGTSTYISSNGTGNHYGIYLNVPGGSNDYAVYTYNGNSVFNEGGGLYDFRIESDVNASMFFVDASTNRVGIGTSTPSQELHVAGDVQITRGIHDGVSFGTAGYVLVTDGAGDITWTDASTISGGNDDWNLLGNAGTVTGTNFLGTTDNVELDFRTNNVIRLRISTKGQLETMNTGYSVFIGQYAGEADDLSNNYNSFVGYNSGRFNSTGAYNSAYGAYSGYNNSTSSYNTTVGYRSFYYSTSSNAYNVALGNEAMEGAAAYINTNHNVALGYQSLNHINGGDYNVSAGSYSMLNNTTSSGNVSIGYRTMFYGTSTNIYNVALGYYAMSGSAAYTGTSYNVGIGYYALYAISGGDHNVAVGGSALRDNTTAGSNTALGYYAMRYNTTGAGNTAIGNSALYNNIDGAGNIAIGSNSMLGTVGNTGSLYNIAIGYASLSDINGGDYNIAVGRYTLENSTTSSFNTAIGDYAMGYATSSNVDNVALGREALRGTGVYTGANSNVAIGSFALTDIAGGDQNVAIGTRTLTSNTTGYSNVAIGFYSQDATTDGHDNISLGYYSLYNNTTGDDNIALGNEAMYNGTTLNANNIALGMDAMKGTAAYTSTNSNIALGNSALYSISGGDDNIALGYHSLYANTSGYRNVSLGYNTMDANVNGYYNVAFGANALGGSSDGNYNVSLGYNSMNSLTTDNDYNVAIGYYAMNGFTGATTSSYNIAIGYRSLDDLNGGDHNVAIGYYSLANSTTAIRNVAMGQSSLENSTTASSNVAIGWQSLQGVGTGSLNVGVGAGAGNLMHAATTGSVYIGPLANAFNALSAYDYCVALGASASVSADRQVRIGNSAAMPATSIGGPEWWSNTSDGRFKKNVEENVPGIDFITKLRPVTYNFDQEALNDFFGVPDSMRNREVSAQDYEIIRSGFIAQEVEQAAIECGYDFNGVDKPGNENDVYNLRYAGFVVPLVKATQEQQEIIESQGAKIEAQEEEIEAQDERIDALEKQIEEMQIILQELQSAE